jgi:DNA uptake protein ComE-like DNA-binding protein
MSMSAGKSVPVLAVLAALLIAPLAHAATTPAPSSTPAAAHEMKAPAPAKPAAMHKVNLNTATREELAALPEMGMAKADKVIAARPFKTKTELLSKGIVTKAEYAKLAPHVMAPPATRTAKPAEKTAQPAAKASASRAK